MTLRTENKLNRKSLIRRDNTIGLLGGQLIALDRPNQIKPAQKTFIRMNFILPKQTMT